MDKMYTFFFYQCNQVKSYNYRYKNSNTLKEITKNSYFEFMKNILYTINRQCKFVKTSCTDVHISERLKLISGIHGNQFM